MREWTHLLSQRLSMLYSKPLTTSNCVPASIPAYDHSFDNGVMQMLLIFILISVVIQQ